MKQTLPLMYLSGTKQYRNESSGKWFNMDKSGEWFFGQRLNGIGGTKIIMNSVKGFWVFLSDLIRDRKIMFGLAKNDLKSRFASSFLGGLWAFIQPLITLLVFWFVFEVGFKNPPVSDVPFVIWFAPSYLVWAFFSEALSAGANSLIEYSYLVKKINFRVSVIPIIKIISSAFVHLIFILFIFFMLIVCQVPVTIYSIQVIYYFICVCVLLTGLCWLLSALAPFVKDTVNVVGVIIQIGFWITPIFWSPEGMDGIVQIILKINPMYYICQGYRDCFVEHIWFWERGFTNIGFWLEACVLLLIGAVLFKKLRPQFADVL